MVYHMISYDIISISYHIISHHIISYHITSHHIISYQLSTEKKLSPAFSSSTSPSSNWCSSSSASEGSFSAAAASAPASEGCVECISYLKNGGYFHPAVLDFPALGRSYVHIMQVLETHLGIRVYQRVINSPLALQKTLFHGNLARWVKKSSPNDLKSSLGPWN